MDTEPGRWIDANLMQPNSAWTPEKIAEHYRTYPEGRYELSGPHGWIQWKGTRVCCDLHCACGESMHFDGDFMYHIKCPECGQVYQCGSLIRLWPIDFEPEGCKHPEAEED